MCYFYHIIHARHVSFLCKSELSLQILVNWISITRPALFLRDPIIDFLGKSGMRTSFLLRLYSLSQKPSHHKISRSLDPQDMDLKNDRIIMKFGRYVNMIAWLLDVTWSISKISHLLLLWGRNKLTTNFLMTVWNVCSWMKICKFRFRFPWSLFPLVQLTILQYWVI